ncbi:sugar ABC transporter permease, partial [Mesorhizobium sp. M1A.T.Ca.IN.004.03.1.1]
MTISADMLDMRRDRRPWLRRLADASEPYLYSAPSLILIIAVMLV